MASALWFADFETTIDVKEGGDWARVWAWCVMEIGNPDNEFHGTDIASFIDFTAENGGTYYFHNLAYDGEYILCELNKNAFTYSDKRKLEAGEFSWLMSGMGKVYGMSICFDRVGKRVKRATFKDSLKKLPMPISAVAKAFGTSVTKGDLNYAEWREPGHELTPEELDYIRRDVRIGAEALAVQFAEGLDALTLGADALKSFRNSIKHYSALFPLLSKRIDDEIRRAYRGGYCYVNPGIEGREIRCGIVYDVNSLYPSVMYDMPLPVGIPQLFKGEYEEDRLYPLYIQHFTATFEIRKDHLPTVQLKNSTSFAPTVYIKEAPEPLSMSMTNVDLQLFMEHYDVEIHSWDGGIKFRSRTGVFASYIDHWTEIKETSTGGKRTIAKLMLNSLYGKFGTGLDVTGKYPVFNENGVVAYKRGPEESRDPVYTSVAVFTTSYARDRMIRTAQACGDRFLYCDTDSVHLSGLKPPDIDIHPTRRGAWKFEGRFNRAKYLRPKTYAEEFTVFKQGRLVDELDVKCAGFSEQFRGVILHDGEGNEIVKEGDVPEMRPITLDDFNVGFHTSYGRLAKEHAPGGVILRRAPFTIS